MTMFSDSQTLKHPFEGTEVHLMDTTQLLAEWMEMKHHGEPEEGKVSAEFHRVQVRAYWKRFIVLEEEINTRIPRPL